MVENRSIYNIIKSPIITEKATRLSEFNKYIFWVDGSSNRIEVKNAVEKVYKVKVKTINIMNVKGKMKRIRWRQEGKTSTWKKALVTLRPGHEIKIT